MLQTFKPYTEELVGCSSSVHWQCTEACDGSDTTKIMVPTGHGQDCLGCRLYGLGRRCKQCLFAIDFNMKV